MFLSIIISKEKMPHRKRILFFPFDLLSHYLRCIVLAKEHFPENNFEVLFLSSSSYSSYVERNGFKTFECSQFDAKKVMECSEKFDFSWLNERDIENVFASQVEVINKLIPDIVLGDTAPSLKMAAEFSGVEYVALMNGYMTKYYSFTRKLSRTHPAYKYSKKLPEKYFDIITEFAERISFKLVHRPFKNLRKRYKLSRVDNYLSEMEGGQNLICDIPDFFPQRDLPDNYKFIQPLIYNPDAHEGAWIETIDKQKPVIFICMGSTGDWRKLSFLNSKAFSKYTIITAGDKEKILFESHIISRGFVNMDEVLQFSDLMICHGGNGTIYHGLKKGIFMFCLTSHFEQEWNVHALERIKYGKSANDFTPKDWLINIDHYLKNKLPTIIPKL
jgi:UDP:flavonoid glycosyltransferase YjiC (YdhE family)